MEDIQVLHGTVVKESMQLPINLLVERDSNHNIYKTIEFERDGNPTTNKLIICVNISVCYCGKWKNPSSEIVQDQKFVKKTPQYTFTTLQMAPVLHFFSSLPYSSLRPALH